MTANDQPLEATGDQPLEGFPPFASLPVYRNAVAQTQSTQQASSLRAASMLGAMVDEAEVVHSCVHEREPVYTSYGDGDADREEKELVRCGPCCYTAQHGLLRAWLGRLQHCGAQGLNPQNFKPQPAAQRALTPTCTTLFDKGGRLLRRSLEPLTQKLK